MHHQDPNQQKNWWERQEAAEQGDSATSHSHKDPENPDHDTNQTTWWDESTVNQGSTDWTPCDPDDPDGIFYWEMEGIYDWQGDLLVVTMLGHLLDLMDDLMGQWRWIEALPTAATPEE